LERPERSDVVTGTGGGESQMMENRRLFLFAAVLFIIAIIGYILGD